MKKLLIFLFLFLFYINFVFSFSQSYISPTPSNASTVTENPAIINVSITGSENVSTWIDFDNSLLGYWNFDNFSGSTIYDLSFNKNNGTLYGDASIISSGARGNATTYDESGDYLLIPDFSYGPDFTLSFWFNSSTNVGSSFQYIFSHGSVGTLNSINIYFVEDSQSGSGCGTNCLRTVLVDTDDSTSNYLDFTFNVGEYDDDSLWHLYTLVANSSGSYLYIDGVFEVSNSQGGDSINPSGSMYLGGRNDLNVDRYYNGEIDEVMIFDRPLSDNEISSLYNSQVNDFNFIESNLNMYSNYSYHVCSINISGNYQCLNERIFFTSHEVICNEGNLSTTCYVNSPKVIKNNYNFSNLVLQNGGSITGESNQNNTYVFNVTENITLESGSSMSLNLDLHANNLEIQKDATINSNNLGYWYNSSTNYGGPGQIKSGSYGGLGGCNLFKLDYLSTPYGNISWPIEFGSGSGIWGGVVDGNKAGGRILLNISQNLILNGEVSSNAVNIPSRSSGWGSHGGSGGSILILTNNFSGNGQISSMGGDAYDTGAYYSSGCSGSGGRVAIYNNFNNFSGIIDVSGGSGFVDYSLGKIGQAGTIYFNDSGKWICDEGDYDSTCVINSGKNIDFNISLNNLILNSSGSLRSIEHNRTFLINVTGNVTLKSGSFIYSNLVLNAQNLEMESGSYISSDELGYWYTTSNGYGGPGQHESGSYGGLGGSTTDTNYLYGSNIFPIDFGSSGDKYGTLDYSVPGGGRILLNISENFIQNGTLTSSSYFSGSSNGFVSSGGSGGSILVIADKIESNGYYYVNGADGGIYSASFGYGGGGGRIAFYCTDVNSFIYDFIDVSGGEGSVGGDDGTFYNNGDTCEIIKLVDYVNPTPNDNSHWSKSNFVIKIKDILYKVTWANIVIDGNSYSMNNTLAGVWEYNYTITSNEIKPISFQVFYDGGILEERTFTFYPDYSNLDGFFSYSLLAGLISLLLLGFNFFNMKSKKAITPVVATMLILVIVVVGGVSLQNWYGSFTSSYDAKQLQSMTANIENYLIIEGIKNEGSKYYLYIRNDVPTYVIIDELKFNDQNCTLESGNVILGKSITEFEVDCISYQSINEVTLFTKNGIIHSKKKLTN